MPSVYEIGYDNFLSRGTPTTVSPTPAMQNVMSGTSPASMTSGEQKANVALVDGFYESSNFVTGVLGWKIDADGNAEFNNVTVRGTIYATVGEIGGFTITATSLYGSTIKTAAVVGVGNTGVIMDTAGLRGYDAVLGLTFNLPTDGSAPTFSSGVISQTIFEINTNAVLRTSATVGDGTASSAGVLINNTGIYACEANQLLAAANVRILATGSAFFSGTVTATAGTFSGITAASIDVSATGYVRGGQSAYNTGTGFWLGYDTSAYKLSIGNPTGNRLTWDGSNLFVKSDTSNLKLYDAVVDASGYGDYTSISDAITDGKKYIFIRNGDYSLDDLLIDFDNNTTIVGESVGGVVIRPQGNDKFISSGGVVVTSTGTISATLDSTTITGSGTDFDSAGVIAYDCILIENDLFEIASVASDTSLNLIKQFDSKANISGVSFKIIRFLKNISIANITISGGYGLYFSYSSNINFTNVDFEYYNDSCIEMSYCDDVKINMCNFKSGSDFAVEAISCFGVSINQSICDSIFFDSCYRCKVSNTYFKNSDMGAYGALTLDNSVECIIADNSFSHCGSSCIRLSTDCNYNVISNNVIDHSSIGIHLAATSDRNIISGNTITDCENTGILVGNANCDNNIVVNNVVYDNAVANITDSGTGTVLANNVVT